MTRTVVKIDKDLKKKYNIFKIFLAYLASGDLNVIVIDWGASAKQIYILAAMSVPRVAHHVARMIGFLRQNGMKTAKAVGHSLGAHLLGIAGYELKDKLDYVVGKFMTK